MEEGLNQYSKSQLWLMQLLEMSFLSSGEVGIREVGLGVSSAEKNCRSNAAGFRAASAEV